jgi:hypothetical protein
MFEIAADTKKVWDRSGDRSERTVYHVAQVSLSGVLLHKHEFVEDLAGAERLLVRVRSARHIDRSLWNMSLRPLELQWPLCDRGEFREIFDGEPNWLDGNLDETH